MKEVLKRPQVIDGHHLKVSRYEKHIPAQETDIAQEKLEKPRTVSVRGVPRTSSTETLTYYFENKRRSKGGPVEGVTQSLEEDVFFVKFDNPEGKNDTALSHIRFVLTIINQTIPEFNIWLLTHIYIYLNGEIPNHLLKLFFVQIY